MPPMQAASRLLQAGRLEAAAEAFEEASRCAPDWAGPLEGLLDIRRRQGQLPAAARIYERIALLRARQLGLQGEAAAQAAHYLSAAAGYADGPPEAMSRAHISGLFDAMADTFDEKLLETLKYTGHERVVEAALRHARGGALAVLDLGCGTGLAGALIRPHAAQLVGVDLSATMLARAEQAGHYDALHERDVVEFLNQRHGPRFDVVIASDVLIYIGAVEPLFRALGPHLAPGGVVVCTVERLDGEGFRLMPSERYAHSRGYLERTGRAVGLELVEFTDFTLRKQYGSAVPGAVATLLAR